MNRDNRDEKTRAEDLSGGLAAQVLDDKEATQLKRGVENAPRKRKAGQRELEREINLALTWARQVKFAAAMLDNVLRGNVTMRFRAGRSEPDFSLTEKGREEAQALADEAREAERKKR